MNKLAVLLTCFNRKEHTISCLSKLFAFKQEFDVFLVDDGSTDGTAEAVSLQFPQVNIIKGDGNLFWNRGMHLAWEAAAQKDYEYYLWLNDDVILYDSCFEELFACAAIKENKAIISGIIETAQKDATLYGGTDENKRLIVPNGQLNPITNMNGNVVLVPKSVFTVLGNLDPVFHHDLGDVDYGLRAIKNNIGVFTTRMAVASGVRNDLCRVRQNNTNIKRRFQKLYSPLGSHPKINFYFRKKHFGFWNACIYFAFLHFLNCIPDFWNTKLFRERYI